MKFNFCGGLDTPNWVLSKIQLLPELSLKNFQLFLDELINDILYGNLNFDNILELTKNTSLNEINSKALFAALTFIIKSSTKHCVNYQTLSDELQQLGTSKEYSEILSEVYFKNFKNLRNLLQSKSLRLNKLISCDYRILRKIQKDNLEINFPLIELNLNLEKNNQSSNKIVLMTSNKLLVLNQELKKVRQTISNFEKQFKI